MLLLTSLTIVLAFTWTVGARYETMRPHMAAYRDSQSNYLDRLNVIVSQTHDYDTLVTEYMYFTRFTGGTIYRDIWAFAVDQNIQLQGAWHNDESVNYTKTELADSDGIRICIPLAAANVSAVMQVQYIVSPGILFYDGSCNNGPVITGDDGSNVIAWQSGDWKQSINRLTVSFVASNESDVLFTLVGFPLTPTAPVVNASWSNVSTNTVTYVRVDGLAPCKTRIECLNHDINKPSGPEWTKWLQFVTLPIAALVGLTLYYRKQKGLWPFKSETTTT